VFAETIDMDTATSLEQEEAKLCILDLGLILTISHAFHSAVPHRTRRVVRSFSFFLRGRGYRMLIGAYNPM